MRKNINKGVAQSHHDSWMGKKASNHKLSPTRETSKFLNLSEGGQTIKYLVVSNVVLNKR